MRHDESQWQWIEYRKHVAPPRFRSAPLHEIDKQTARGRSLYYPTIQSREVEERVLHEGVYVRSRKPATIYKVKQFDQDVGASSGLPSRWVKIEITNGQYHGRPITQVEFDRLMKQPIPCCE